MKVLFLHPYPTEGASNRYRVEQFLPYLSSRNIGFKLRPFYFSKYFKIRYVKGNILKKCIFFILCSLNRFLDVFIRIWFYDVIFIHIEVFPVGPAILEKFLSLFKKNIVFDFEDAIYLKSKSLINWLKCPEKFFSVVKICNRVIVCNKYLKEFLLPYNKNIHVIPTSINTEIFVPSKNDNEIPIIGWIGSPTTLFCLDSIYDVFSRLAKKHKFILKVIGGGGKLEIQGVRVVQEQWSLEKEVANFQKLDIGVYPLPDNEWTLAKTPFKSIQYMAVGVPCVASAVGGNKDIIKDGENGFLADNQNDWYDKLNLLLSSKELRNKIGIEGRKFVKKKYSLHVTAPKFLETLINMKA